MWYMIKISSIVVIIFTLYMLGIFLAPTPTDKLADMIWIKWFNDSVRWLKSWADTVGDDMLQVKEDQWAVDMARDAMKSTQDKIKQWQDVVNEANWFVEKKIDQTNKVIESGQKVVDSTKQLKQDVDNLTNTSSTWTSKK